jgi:hypothetical protein
MELSEHIEVRSDAMMGKLIPLARQVSNNFHAPGCRAEHHVSVNPEHPCPTRIRQISLRFARTISAPRVAWKPTVSGVENNIQ